MAERSGDHQRGATAIIAVVKPRTAVDEQLEDFVHVFGAGFVRVAGCPHQHGEIVAVTPVGINVTVEQLPHDGGKATTGGIADGGLPRGIDDVGIGALVEQQTHKRLVPHEGRGGHGCDTAAAREIDVGAMRDQSLDCRASARFGGEKQRCRSIEVTRIDGSAMLKE